MTPIERLREAAAVPAVDVIVSRTDLADVLDTVDMVNLEARAIYAVLMRFSYAVQQTRWPKMDNSQWQAVIDLAHGRPVVTLIAEARTELAADKGKHDHA